MNEDYFIAVDFHCKYQKVTWVNRATGETGEADLEHADLEKLRQWYRGFRPGTVVGMEAGGYSWWFEQLIQEVGLELKVGHPGHIARMRLRKQKNDRRDAEHLPGLLVREEFPQVWRPDTEQREQKTLIRYRVKLMQERTRCVNTLRALVYNFNLQIKSGSLSKASREKIRALSMGARLERERDELLDRIEELEERIRERQKEIEGWAAQDPEAVRLMTIPGVGPLTSLSGTDDRPSGAFCRHATGGQLRWGSTVWSAARTTGTSGDATGRSASREIGCCAGCWCSRRWRRRDTTGVSNAFTAACSIAKGWPRPASCWSGRGCCCGMKSIIRSF